MRLKIKVIGNQYEIEETFSFVESWVFQTWILQNIGNIDSCETFKTFTLFTGKSGTYKIKYLPIQH